MKKLLIATATLAAVGTSAFAADMPVKAPIYKAPPPVYTWTGCYVGGNVGGAWAKSDWTYRNINPYDAFGPAGPIIGTDNSFSMSDVIGGVQGGCNYEFANNVVVGIEGTWSGTHLDQTNPNVVQVFAPIAAQTVETTINSMYTIAGRLGYAFAPAWLGYVKGGYASAKINTAGVTGAAVPGFNWTSSNWNDGYVVGVGTEYKLTPNVVVGAEYDYIGLSTHDQVGAIPAEPAFPAVHGVNASVQSVTARLSFMFSPGH
jgi:outer membrane immunogenic protein